MPDASNQQILYVQEHQTLFPGVAGHPGDRPVPTRPTAWPRPTSSATSARSTRPSTRTSNRRATSRATRSARPASRPVTRACCGASPGSSRCRSTPRATCSAWSATRRRWRATPGPHHRRQRPEDRRQMPSNRGLAAARKVSMTRSATSQLPAPAGAVVIENPTTATSWPWPPTRTTTPTSSSAASAEANYATLTNPDNYYPLIDRTIQGQYQPGSTFKLVTATAGLQYGLITPDHVFDDTGGSSTIGNQFFSQRQRRVVRAGQPGPGHHRVERHPTSTRSAPSSGHRGSHLRRRRLAERGRRVRLRQQTGIELPNEASGLDPRRRGGGQGACSSTRRRTPTGPGTPATRSRSPSARTRSWSPRCSWPTPTPAFANGGTVYQPQIASAITDPRRARR